MDELMSYAEVMTVRGKAADLGIDMEGLTDEEVKLRVTEAELSSPASGIQQEAGSSGAGLAEEEEEAVIGAQELRAIESRLDNVPKGSSAVRLLQSSNFVS